MPEAVIVATARSPIGRANKGSLVSLRTDEMAAQIVRALMAKVPSVKGSDIEDLIIGVGQPAGEAGFNLGRMVALLAGIPEAPGVVVNRYCSSSLQTIRMAAHAIKAGEGDCFIAAGVKQSVVTSSARPTLHQTPSSKDQASAPNCAPSVDSQYGLRKKVWPTPTWRWVRLQKTYAKLKA